MRKKTVLISCIAAIIAMVVFSGACQYYKAVQVPSNEIDSLQSSDRYFILRNANFAYHMKDAKISEDRTMLSCTLDSVNEDHQLYIRNKKRGGTYLRKPENKNANNGPQVLNEVHFYIPFDKQVAAGAYRLELRHVYKIEVIEHDKRKTTGNAIGAVAITLGSIAAIAGVIIVLTKASCPFVSAYNGEEFELQGEIFGGAIYPQLARDDYMPLRMKPAADGSLMIKISNELKEKQYTDLADLLVITHQKDARVLADSRGNLYSISDPVLPSMAWNCSRADLLPLIIEKGDGLTFDFNDTLAVNQENFLSVKFKKASPSIAAKLVLSAKNTFWIDNLYQEVAKEFGDYYPSYARQQLKKPASSLIRWAQEQQLPLTISMKTNSGWQVVGSVPTIGPLATRDIVVPLDLGNVFGDEIELRMSTGFMFWDIDYAAIEFSDDKSFSVQVLSPAIAVDEKGKNVLPEIREKDGRFLEQPAIGNVAIIKYKCDLPGSDVSRSYILHARGYYTHMWDFKGEPNYAFLKQLKKPNTLSAYSAQQYKKSLASNLAALTMN